MSETFDHSVFQMFLLGFLGGGEVGRGCHRGKKTRGVLAPQHLPLTLYAYVTNPKHSEKCTLPACVHSDES